MNNKTIYSLSSNSLENFIEKYKAIKATAGLPSLAILFVNADLDIAGLNKFLVNEEVDHIGASTAGEICDKYFEQGIYSGLFFYIPREAYKLVSLPINEDTGSTFGKIIKDVFPQPAVYW